MKFLLIKIISLVSFQFFVTFTNKLSCTWKKFEDLLKIYLHAFRESLSTRLHTKNKLLSLKAETFQRVLFIRDRDAKDQKC